MKLERKNIPSDVPFEPIFAYSRAVKMGPFIFVAGTGALQEDGKVVGIDDPYAQTMHILKKIEVALSDAGAKLKDVVRTRLFVTHISDWDEIAKAHREVFGTIFPASCVIQVQGFKVPEMRLVIECEAVIHES